jgi:ribosomal protein L37E
MGLRCLLGHEYANREVEREREERGDEVVVTYRTVETCDRCGERRIVSENKEVRPVRNPREDDVTTGLGGGVTPDLGEPDDEDGTAVSGTPSPGADADAEAQPTDADPASTAPEAEAGPEPDPDVNAADEDDAIILDDGPESDDGERGHGEWPDDDDGAGVDADPETETDADPEAETADDGTTVVSGDDGWPEPDGEDEGFDADPNGGPTDVTIGGNATPEREDATNGTTGTATNGTTSAAGKQFVAAEEIERVGEESSDPTEFFCPNCGYAREAGGSSMRAGDICPDCHKGYIAERGQ